MINYYQIITIRLHKCYECVFEMFPNASFSDCHHNKYQIYKNGGKILSNSFFFDLAEGADEDIHEIMINSDSQCKIATSTSRCIFNKFVVSKIIIQKKIRPFGNKFLITIRSNNLDIMEFLTSYNIEIRAENEILLSSIF